LITNFGYYLYAAERYPLECEKIYLIVRTVVDGKMEFEDKLSYYDVR